MSNPFVAPVTTEATATGGKRAKRPVHSYVNLALNKDGGTVKIDMGLRLYADDAELVRLGEFMQTAEGIEWFKSNVIVTCNKVGVDKGKFGF